MWKRVCACFRRHRRKLLIAGGVIGGVVVLNRFLTRKFIEWQTKQTVEYFEQLKRQHHFEGTLQTCDNTVITLAPKVREILLKLQDDEPYVDALKSKPSNKLEIWSELKVIVFARAFSELYCECLLVVFLRIQLSILGGYMFVDSQRSKIRNDIDTDGLPVAIASQEIQQKYLGFVHHFFNSGIKDISKIIEEAVKVALSGISLKHKVMLKDFSELCDTIKRYISHGSTSCIPVASNYLLPLDGDFQSSSHSNVLHTQETLSKLKIETKDILDSSDFDKVMSCCLERGFSMLMDRLSECFVHLNQNNNFTNPHNVELPFARLIPVVRTVMHQYHPQDKGSLVKELLQLDILKTFAANVYEAFCQNNKEETSILNFTNTLN